MGESTETTPFISCAYDLRSAEKEGGEGVGFQKKVREARVCVCACQTGAAQHGGREIKQGKWRGWIIEDSHEG